MSAPGTSNDPPQNRYKKRTDGSGPSSAGDAYEAALHGAVALLAYSNGIAGEQTCEESGLGCLDDLCFKYKDGDGRKLILLQAKHSVDPKNISEVHVKADYGGGQDDTFSLAKYFMAFLEAKRTAMKNGDTVQQVVLFTNRPLGKRLSRKCKNGKMEKPLQVLLNFPNNNGALFYNFPDNLWNVDEVRTASNMTKKRKTGRDELVQWWESERNVPLDELQKEFHEKLVFAVCQPNVVELQQAEERLLKNLPICKSMSDEGKKGVMKFFRDDLKKWMDARASGSGGGKVDPEPWTSERTEQCLRNAIAHVAQLKIEGLSEANFRLLKNGVSIEVDVSPRFPNEEHVFNTQQLTVYARLAAGTETASQSDSRLLRAEELAENLDDGFAVMEGMTIVIVHDSQKLSSTVDDTQKQMSKFSLNTIILTNQPGVGTPLSEVHGSDLSEATLDQIMEKDIKFQGHTLKIKDVVDGNNGLRSLLDPNMVELMSLGKTVEIGKQAESPEEPYVVRHLAEISKSTAEPDTGEALWLRSKTFLEEGIIMKAKEGNKHVIVSAPPGAGKSSLATSMCSRVKEQQPAWWVGKCDLKDKMTALGEYKEKKGSLPGEESRTNSEMTQLEFDLLWELFSVEKVEQRLIKDRLVSRTGHVVFIIDSYDEIEHMYGSEFEAFIKPLAKLNVCVCVTTREHLLERAESVFEGHLEFRLEMLDDNEQIDLLVKLWQQNKNGDPQSLRSEAEKLRGKLPGMFCANPLHLYMISEIDYSSIEASEMTLYEMYQEFVQTKFDRYWRESKFDPRTEAEKNNKAIIEDLTQIAIWHLLGESHQWNSDEERTLLLSRVQKKNVGFIVQGHPRFVHESYAEYFLSRQVYEMLRSGEEISDIMVKNRFRQVRLFLDGRLKSDQNLPILLNALLSSIEEDLLLNCFREGLETLSLHAWKYCKFFSNKTQQKAFSYGVRNCLQPVVEQAIQDGIDVDESVDIRIAFDEGLNGSETRQLSVLQALISKGYHLPCKTEYHRPLLHTFIGTGTYPRVVTLLVELGCNVHDVDYQKQTALHYAAWKGNFKVVKLLIEKGCDVEAVTQSGMTVLHCAAESGNVEVVKLLIEKGCDVNAMDHCGKIALHLAARLGNDALVKLLIEKGCDVNAVTNNGLNVLHLAARWSNVEVVRLLIEKGCDARAVCQDGQTVLHIAALEDNVKVVKLLIEKGCDVKAVCQDGETLLHCAAWWGNVELVKLLIEKGCDVKAVCQDGGTVLHLAAGWGNVELVKLLIEKGCDVKAVCQNGLTALHLAAWEGNVEVVKLLIEKGCDVKAATQNGLTALHIAALGSKVELVKLLIEKGCDVKGVTQSGETVLHIAARQGKAAIVTLLIEKGCDVIAVTQNGLTALDLAAGKGRIDVVELLQQAFVRLRG